MDDDSFDQGTSDDSNARPIDLQTNGSFWPDDGGSSQQDQMPSSLFPSHSSFFAQDPDTDNESALHSYYQQDMFQPTFSQSSAPIFSQLSQASNLSAAELSRMDESIQESMQSQSHHDEAEMSRQRKKMERKSKYGQGSIIKKRPKYHYSESQMKRNAIYRRFRYEKTLDVSQEEDIGGSIEYLVRRKLNEAGEQRRLMEIAKKREAERKEKEQEGREKQMRMQDDDAYGEKEEGGQSGQNEVSKSEPNWNFLEEGYVTMPRIQASKLPYYFGNIAKEKLGNRKADDRSKMRSKNDTASVRDTTCSVRSRKRKRKEIKWDTSSFPLHFNQLNPKMDLRSFTSMTNTGQEGMISLHGRLAKQLWARLVSGGANMSMLEDSSDAAPEENKEAVKQEDTASDMSHSSDSSESFGAADLYGGSDYNSQFNSQAAFGFTSVVGIDTGNADDPNDSITKQNQSIRLMALVHSLPNLTHRNRFYVKIATELSTLRQIWENEFESFFRSDDNLDKLGISRSGAQALKSFFGADGKVTPGPFWCSDPAVATDITRMYRMMYKNRMKLVPRLRRTVQQASDGLPPTEIIAHSGAVTLKIESEKDGLMDIKDSGSEKSETKGVTDIKMETSGSQEHIEFKAEPNDEQTAADNSYMSELSHSLLNSIQLKCSLNDKYAKTVHEANIDTSNICISLASFLNELTASKAQLYNLEQLDTVSPLDQGKRCSAKENTGRWNEIIVEYLTLAESLTNPVETNLHKRHGKVPQYTSLAQVALSRHSYASNGGGMGFNSKKKKLNQSSRLSNIKEEDDEYGSDDDQDEQHRTMDFSLKELHAIHKSGADIVKRGKEYLSNKHLELFTPIHLTTGIAMLTEQMTPQSAEILSRYSSPDNPEFRTPFDAVKSSLSCLDTRGELIPTPTDSRSRWDAQGKVVDEVLVSSWENAAVLFRKCVKDEPRNIDNWSWYVGSLLGIVCVSSGVSLSKVMTDSGSSVKSEESFNENKTSRHQLYDHDQRRRQAARAIHDLIKVAEEIDCPMFHMAISSMFEWKQAMYFIEDHFSYSEVKRLHSVHTYKWAAGDCSEDSLVKVQALYQAGDISLDSLLCVLARSIETNPTCSSHWYRLANTLASEIQTPDHNIITDDINQYSQSWWAPRRQEWDKNFFQSPPLSATKVKAEFVSMVLDTIDSIMPFMDEVGINDSSGRPPKNISADPMCEALCLRVVIAYHMFGDCRFVSNSIWWLAVKSWKSKQRDKTNNAYLNGLKWLSLKGLDILEYLTKMRIQSL